MPFVKANYLNDGHARKAVVREALGWIGTPYLKGQELKGVYADCATFINGVMGNAGVFHDDELTKMVYAYNGHNGQNDELYMIRLLRHAKELIGKNAGEVVIPLPGDIVAVKAGKVYNHGGIVINWPTVIHAYDPEVAVVQANVHPIFTSCDKKFFSPWSKVSV